MRRCGHCQFPLHYILSNIDAGSANETNRLFKMMIEAIARNPKPFYACVKWLLIHHLFIN